MSRSYSHHALLAWELGSGRGHVAPLAAIARSLLRRGARVTFASQRVDALRSMRPVPDGMTIVQAPIWPALLVSAGSRQPLPPFTFGDILAPFGLHDSGAVEFLLRAWDGLFAATSPDVVVTNFAPMADLAARGRVPVVGTGDGFTLPPSAAPTYPRLARGEPVYPEGGLLRAVNLALRRCGRSELRCLPELGAVDRRFPHVLAVLDPYRATRREPRLPPIMPAWTPGAAEGGDEVFIYLPDTFPRQERLVAALVGLGFPMRAHLANLPAFQAEKLAAAGVTIEARPVPLAEIVARSRLVVSHGGTGTVSMALAAGLPQVVLAPDLEKQINGLAIERLGVGRSFLWPGAATEEIVAATTALAADSAVRDRARGLAGNFAAEMSGVDPVETIAKAALDLAGAAKTA